MNEQYLSIKVVAKIIGVTPLTLRNWDRRGILVAYRNPVNNYRLYRYADVADFIAAIKRSGPRQPGAERIPIRLEEETATDGSEEIAATGTAPADAQLPGAESGVELPATYSDAVYADIREQQVPERGNQSDAGAV